jgi:hypothetical protein
LQTENIVLILVAIAITIPVWQIVSAYNRRVNEINELRDEVEKLKRRVENADTSASS